jgi:hypothetical protein
MTATATRPYEYDEFCRERAATLGLPAERLVPCGPLIEGLGLDELSLAAFLAAVEDLNPWFRIPDQVDGHDATVADVHHYYATLSRGHVVRTGGEER